MYNYFESSDQYKPQKLKSNLSEDELDYEWLQSLITNLKTTTDETSAVDGFFAGLVLFMTMFAFGLCSTVAILVLWRYYCWRSKTKQSLIALGKKKTVGGIKKSFTYMLKPNRRLQPPATNIC